MHSAMLYSGYARVKGLLVKVGWKTVFVDEFPASLVG